MRAHWADVISSLDKVIDIVRSSWIKNPEKWDNRLDTLLAERFALMQKRDLPT